MVLQKFLSNFAKNFKPEPDHFVNEREHTKEAALTNPQ
jgi:hypothetical protein